MTYTASTDGSTVTFGASSFLVDQNLKAFVLEPNGANNSAKLEVNGVQVTAAPTNMTKLYKHKGAVYGSTPTGWRGYYTGGSTAVQMLMASAPTVASPSGTVIKPGNSLVSPSLDVWGFTTTGTGYVPITKNGVPYAASSGSDLLSYNGQIYTVTGAGWYKATATNWSFITTDPRTTGAVLLFTENWATLDVGAPGSSAKWSKGSFWDPAATTGYAVNESWMAGRGAGQVTDVYAVSGGELILGLHTVPSGYEAACGYKPLVGGQLISNFSRQYGYFEVEAKMPKVQGTNYALWLIGNGAWPPETDFAEVVTVPTGEQFAAQSSWVQGEPGIIDQIVVYGKDHSVYHKYGVLITPTQTKFYFDRVLTETFATPAVYDRPMFIALSSQNGADNWTGPVASGVSPGPMYVRAVNVWDGLPF